jgi:signal transduction histidine kinase
VFLVGLSLVAVTLGSILIAERPVLEMLALRGVLLGPTVESCVFGYWLVWTGTDPDLIARVAGWGVAVAAVLGLLAAWAIVSQLLLGQQPPPPVRITLGGTTVGFITGCVAGYYHEKSRRRARELAAIRGERLEVLASLLSHDLRSPLDVASGRLRRLQQDLGEDHEDLAGGGEPIEELDSLSLGQFAKQCWGTLDTPDAQLVVESDLTFGAHRGRAATFFQNLFRNAIVHGGEGMTIEIGRHEDGF